MHAEMARIWLDVDRDPETRVAILRGEGKGFSAGGDLAMVEEMTQRLRPARARLARGARSRLQPDQLLEDRSSRRCTARRSARGSSRACSPTSRSRRRTRASSTATRASASRRATTPRSSGRSSAAWRRRSTTCCICEHDQRRGGRAPRPRLAHLRGSELQAKALEVARKLAARRADRAALDQVLAQQLAAHGGARRSTPRSRSRCSASPGPEAKEGVASHREKRKPGFPPEPKDF